MYWVGFTIIDGESRLVKVMRELGLLITPRERGARNLSFSHSVMPLASPWWCFRFLMITVSSRRVTR